MTATYTPITQPAAILLPPGEGERFNIIGGGIRVLVDGAPPVDRRTMRSRLRSRFNAGAAALTLAAVRPVMRQLLASAVACLWLAGCGPKPTAHTYARHNLAGGKYLIDCEDTGGGSSLAFRSSADGTSATKELYKFSWASTRELRIEDEKLIVDGKDKGTLQPGDRITIKASGDLLVNGAPR